MARFLFARCFIPTFNLPNLNEHLPRMASNHTVGGTNAGWAPNIVGSFKVIFHSGSWDSIATGSFYPTGPAPQAQIAGGSYCNNYTIAFSASRTWAGYNDSVASIMAANVTMLFIIKY